MMIQENILVNVNSAFGQGLGIVRHVSDFSFSPIQVELFEPDEDGHKFIRFYHNEVTPVEYLQPIECLYPEEVELEVELVGNEITLQVEPEPEEVEPEEPLIIDENPPIDKFVRMIKKCAGYSFKVGDIFKASGTGSKYDTCYYLYDLETGKQRGCMLKEFFEIIDSPENVQNAPEIVPEPVKVIEPERDLDDEITAKVERRIEMLKQTFKKKKPKQTRDVLELKGQVTLFDILEV